MLEEFIEVAVIFVRAFFERKGIAIEICFHKEDGSIGVILIEFKVDVACVGDVSEV